jgi:hypothetical protein
MLPENGNGPEARATAPAGPKGLSTGDRIELTPVGRGAQTWRRERARTGVRTASRIMAPTMAGCTGHPSRVLGAAYAPSFPHHYAREVCDAMMQLDTRAVAARLGGEAVGRNAVLAPGPGHSPADRSLSIKLDPGAPDGFRCYSFAGDDWRACRDHVRVRLGIGPPEPRRPAAPRTPPTPARDVAGDHDNHGAHDTASALRIWAEARHPAGTAVEAYLAGRELFLAAIAGDVIRFHPALKFMHPDAGARNGTFVGGMVTLFRDLRTNNPCGICRTFLDCAGRPFLDGKCKKIRNCPGCLFGIKGAVGH